MRHREREEPRGELALAIMGERNQRGMTQAQFARAIGVSLNTIARWESANVIPESVHLRAMRLAPSPPLPWPDGLEEQGWV